MLDKHPERGYLGAYSLEWPIQDAHPPLPEQVNDYITQHIHDINSTRDLIAAPLSIAQEQIVRGLWSMLINKSGIPIELSQIESKIKLAQTPSQWGPPKVKIGNIEFTAIEPANLKSAPLLIQALDNQWLPRQIWHAMMKKGNLTKEMKKQLDIQVRTEYIRGLINGKQVVINRAYIYNTSIVFQDFLPDSQNRKAFKALLESGIIIPYLFKERTPVEPPNFDKMTQGFLAWQQICQEVDMSCVRLSWDDQLNEKLSNEKLASRFHNFARHLPKDDLDKYLQDLSLDQSEKKSLEVTFKKVQQLCQKIQKEENFVTRTDLYKEFILSGKSPIDRGYDINKPYAGEVKELIDLSYNSYLADALGGFLLTPLDSLPRTALQEWERTRDSLKTITIDELIQLLRLSAFDLTQGQYLKSLSLLQLNDILEVRRMDEWAKYIAGVETLLRKPSWFADGTAVRVYQNYADLMNKIAERVIRRSSLPESELIAIGTPLTELIIDVSGAQLSVLWTSVGPRYRFSGETLPQITSSEAAPFVARFNVYYWNGKSSQAELVNSFDFMKGTMQDAQKQWREVQRQVQKLPGFQERLVD